MRGVNTLAIETSSHRGSLALRVKGEVIEVELPADKPASSLIYPAILKLLAEASLTVKDIDLIAYGDGPGAFTGVRTACAAAQALALPFETPVSGVCTLAAVAVMSGEAHNWVQLDARMGELYAAAYVITPGALQCWVAPEVAVLAKLTQPDVSLAWRVLSDLPTARGVLAAQAFFNTLPAREAGLRYVRNNVAQTEAERGKVAA
jgi:tRNA threonylcarbamoyladenosine biosynthesis protein TsaB